MKLRHGVAALLVALALRSAAAETQAANPTAPAAPPKKTAAAPATHPAATAPAKSGTGANRLDGIAAVVNDEVVPARP